MIEVSRFFFQLKENYIWIGKNYIFYLKLQATSVTSFSYYSSKVPCTWGTLLLLFLQSPQAHWHLGPLHLPSPFWKTSLNGCVLYFVWLSAWLSPPRRLPWSSFQKEYSSFILSLLWVTFLHSPYHCLTRGSMVIYVIFLVFLPNKSVSFMRAGTWWRLFTAVSPCVDWCLALSCSINIYCWMNARMHFSVIVV